MTTALQNPRFSLPAAILRHDGSVAAIVVRCLLGERDRDGTPLLREQPTPDEARLLRQRLHALGAALAPASAGDLKMALLEMLNGFGSSRAGVAEAQMVVAQYITVLAGYPAWAVRLACNRFAQGAVGEDECPGWQRAFAPTTAQMVPVVERYIQAHRTETAGIHDVLRGRLEAPLSPGERERVGKGLADLAQMLRDKAAADRKLFGGMSPREQELADRVGAIAAKSRQTLAELAELGGKPWDAEPEA